MEAHPIPQNVTAFQFKLVGDMTLKQFLYLATGFSIAYLIFVFFAVKYPFLAWPPILLFSGLGAAFAFLPISSRPLDHWVMAFFKAVYTPTERVWVKKGKAYQKEPLFQSRYIMYMSSLQPEEPGKIQTISAPKDQTIRQAVLSGTPTIAELPTQEELQKTVELAKQAQALQVRIIQTERALGQIRVVAQQPKPIPQDYSLQVNKIFSDLQNLMSQASQIRNQLDALTKPEVKLQVHPQPVVPPKVIKVTLLKPKAQELTLTTLPNVINGIVKDNLGNYLAGVITVIYDKEGLPVRALKSNKLGQFTGSTPLPSGTYTLELEKENFQFDVLQIELTGSVLAPLLITAKLQE